MNARTIIFGIIILILLGFISYQEISHQKKIVKVETDLEFSEMFNDSILNAKVFVDTIRDTIWRKSKPIIIKDIQAVDSFRVFGLIYERYVEEFDSVIQEPVFDRTYDTSFVTADFSIPFRLSVRGKLNWIKHSEYTLNQETIATSEVVIKPVPVYREEKKSHLYLWAMGGYPFDPQWPISFEGGLMYMHKTNWGIMGGYQRFDKINIVKFGVSLKLL